MNAIEPAESAAPSLGRDLVAAACYYLGGRHSLLVLGAVAVVVSAASSWSWLVSAGITPLLVAMATCAAMCALGLCMHRMSGGTQAAQQDAPPQTDPRQLALDLGGLEPAARPTDVAGRLNSDQGVGSYCKPK